MISVGVYASKKLFSLEENLENEINEIKKEIEKLKEQSEKINIETFNEIEKIPTEDLRKIAEVNTTNWSTYIDEEFGYEIKYPSNKLRIEKKLGYDGRKYTAFYFPFEDRLRIYYSPYPFPEGIAIRVEVPGIWATLGPRRLIKARNLSELERILRKAEKGFRLDIERVVGDHIEGLKIDRSTNKYFAWDIYILKGETHIMVISVVSDSSQIPPLFKQMICSIKFINEI